MERVLPSLFYKTFSAAHLSPRINSMNKIDVSQIASLHVLSSPETEPYAYSRRPSTPLTISRSITSIAADGSSATYVLIPHTERIRAKSQYARISAYPPIARNGTKPYPYLPCPSTPFTVSSGPVSPALTAFPPPNCAQRRQDG